MEQKESDKPETGLLGRLPILTTYNRLLIHGRYQLDLSALDRSFSLEHDDGSSISDDRVAVLKASRRWS